MDWRSLFEVLLGLVNLVLLGSAIYWMRRAKRDSLTGLLNHGAIKEQIRQELSKMESYPISVLMIDIDEFKKYNDHHGHQRGDLALELVAAVLKRILRTVPGRREHDLVGRWGGEEFCVVLPNTDAKGALVVAERIRLGVTEASNKAGYAKITVSIGVATVPADAPMNMQSLVHEADLRLYRAKHEGRDQVVGH